MRRAGRARGLQRHRSPRIAVLESHVPHRRALSSAASDGSSDLEDFHPHIWVSHDGRVSVIDRLTCRRLHLLGRIRGFGRDRRFLLATPDNGFYALLDDGLRALLCDLDGVRLSSDFTETSLATLIGERMELG